MYCSSNAKPYICVLSEEHRNQQRIKRVLVLYAGYKVSSVRRDYLVPLFRPRHDGQMTAGFSELCCCLTGRTTSETLPTVMCTKCREDRNTPRGCARPGGSTDTSSTQRVCAKKMTNRESIYRFSTTRHLASRESVCSVARTVNPGISCRIVSLLVVVQSSIVSSSSGGIGASTDQSRLWESSRRLPSSSSCTIGLFTP